MLSEIEAELQAKGADENRILQQECFYGSNGTDGPLPRCTVTGRPVQERLALIVG